VGVIEGLLWLALCLAMGVGWLAYKLCEHVLIPSVEACVELLAELSTWIKKGLGDWWRRVTVKWRIQRIERKTRHQMDATYRDHVRQVEALEVELEETESKAGV